MYGAEIWQLDQKKLEQIKSKLEQDLQILVNF